MDSNDKIKVLWFVVAVMTFILAINTTRDVTKNQWEAAVKVCLPHDGVKSVNGNIFQVNPTYTRISCNNGIVVYVKVQQ